MDMAGVRCVSGRCEDVSVAVAGVRCQCGCEMCQCGCGRCAMSVWLW